MHEADDNVANFGPKGPDYSEQRAKMHGDIKCQPLIIPTEKLKRQDQVSRT